MRRQWVVCVCGRWLSVAPQRPAVVNRACNYSGNWPVYCLVSVYQLFVVMVMTFNFFAETPTGLVWIRRTLESEGGHFFVTRYNKCRILDNRFFLPCTNNNS